MRRRVGLLMLVGAMAPLGVAATAWACASLAKIAMASRVVDPGQSVRVTGTGFSDTHAGVAAGDSRVALRLQTRRGKVLQEVDAVSGKIDTALTIPSTLSPGYYVLLATQSDATGKAKAGTPARYSFRITGASVARSAAGSPWGGASSGPPHGPNFPEAVAGAGDVSGQTVLVGGMLTLVLLAAGGALVGRRSQTMTLRS